MSFSSWNAKVGSQELSGVTGKFGLGVQNEAEQRLIAFCQDNALVIANTLNTESRLITFFAVEDREAPYSQQKQDRELTVTQIMNFLLPNSDLN